jgi:hypothetical protein
MLLSAVGQVAAFTLHAFHPKALNVCLALGRIVK